MPITIRRAAITELDELTELAMRSKQSNGYDAAFMAACRDELTVTAARFSEGEYWVAESNELCGCACLVINAEQQAGLANELPTGLPTGLPTELPAGLPAGPHAGQNFGEVHTFFIDPNYQRKGIGRLLWQKIQSRAAQEGLQFVQLDADPQAVAFYAAMGFEVIGQTPSGSIKGRFLPKMAWRF